MFSMVHIEIKYHPTLSSITILGVQSQYLGFSHIDYVSANKANSDIIKTDMALNVIQFDSCLIAELPRLRRGRRDDPHR